MSAQAEMAIAAARIRVRQRVAVAVARSKALGAQIGEVLAENELLTERALDLLHACRLQRSRRGGPAVGRFTVEGMVDGEEVRASWADGRLACDELLRSRALLLVDLEEEFVYSDPPRCFIASLDGPPIAVALTMIRACDRVTRIMLAPPEAA
jgi:hypothetical protein